MTQYASVTCGIPESTASTANRPRGEVISLADRRHAQLVEAAEKFLSQARSFGAAPPPVPAPAEVNLWSLEASLLQERQRA